MASWSSVVGLLAALAAVVSGNGDVRNETGSECLAALATPGADALRRQLATGQSMPYDAGKYAMCMNVPGTRYFLVSMTASMPQKPSTDLSVQASDALAYEQIHLGAGASPALAMPVELGFCVPEVCSAADVPHFIGRLVPMLGVLNVTIVQATSPQLDLKPKDLGFILAWSVVGVLVASVVVSTAVVLATRASGSARSPSEAPQSPMLASERLLGSAGVSPPARRHDTAASPASTVRSQRPRLGLFVEAFSMVGEGGTLPKLVETAPYKPTDCLNGLRVLSMNWIVLGHSFIMAKAIAGFQNAQDIVLTPLNSNAAEGKPGLMFVLNAQMGVDTFFFLAGFLLALATLRELRQRNGKINVLLAVVLRYLRLTPSLAFVLLVFYKIWPHMAMGPFAPRFQDSILSRCAGSWWSELTYTLNFIPFDSDKVCMGWTWYLGDDMIFFIVGIALVPVYYRRRWQGWVSLALLAFASTGVTAWLIVHYHLSIYVFDSHYTQYSYYAYSKPYTRIPAYLVGIASAWVLDSFERRGITRDTRPNTWGAHILARIAALMALGTLLFLVFIACSDFGQQKDAWSDNTSAVYLAVGRPLWAACCAVLVFLCYYGYLPLIDGFLSHSIWTPFARLTYGAYLLHPLVIKLAAGNAGQYYTFGFRDLLFDVIGNNACAYGGSLILWMMVERPIMSLTTALLKKQRRAGAGRPQPGEADAEKAVPSLPTATLPAAPAGR